MSAHEVKREKREQLTCPGLPMMPAMDDNMMKKSMSLGKAWCKFQLPVIFG
jgi:hypothetical protein